MKNHVPILAAVFILLFQGCSINQLAMKAVADALTGEGSSDVFTGDNDPELVGDALPFAIKLYESLLSANPGHEGLVLSTGSLYVMYANAFVQTPSLLLPIDRFAEQVEAKNRAKNLYLRGADMLYDGLEKKFPGFKTASQTGKLPQILAKMKKAEVPLLYWSAAGYLAAYSLNTFDMELGIRIPELIALIDRAYELDPDFNSGALDDFYVLFHASVPVYMGGDKSKVEPHFERALEKSGGHSASPYVSYAESVSYPALDYDSYRKNLEAALAINPDNDPSNRLVNIITQRKAQHLLDTAEMRFGINSGWDDWD